MDLTPRAVRGMSHSVGQTPGLVGVLHRDGETAAGARIHHDGVGRLADTRHLDG